MLEGCIVPADPVEHILATNKLHPFKMRHGVVHLEQKLPRKLASGDIPDREEPHGGLRQDLLAVRAPAELRYIMMVAPKMTYRDGCIECAPECSMDEQW